MKMFYKEYKAYKEKVFYIIYRMYNEFRPRGKVNTTDAAIIITN